MRLRERLLPYLYTTFAQYHFDGTPPIRAMALVEGFRAERDNQAGVTSETNPYAEATRRDIHDQFMLGDNLLVAPMFAGDSTRTVVLPAGKWYDFYSGALAGSGEVITVKPGLERIPLFVRDGGIFPLLAGERRQVPRVGETVDLEVRHYGDADGRFELYDDDGTTFGYERGAFSWTTLAVARDAAGKLTGTMQLSPAGRRFGYGAVQWRMMGAR
jgi:alpha-D-xyloside xylohydrolase